jgi:preprotein translocase subunit SecA
MVSETLYIREEEDIHEKLESIISDVWEVIIRTSLCKINEQDDDFEEIIADVKCFLSTDVI